MEHVELIDYAHPLMMAERNLRDGYNALIEGDLEVGETLLINAAVEVKMALNAVRHAKESKRA
jgi:hypothetical protein